MTNAKDEDCKLSSPDEYKIFSDPVHGPISLHPLLAKIVDTPQFQRLRNIKQLGSTYYVYPGASHNRFEHSIGTAYLAGKLARKIQRQKNPELEFEGRKVVVLNKDVLCVEIAGLCHDLGHGPFSHVFEKVFLKRKEKDWKHEKTSCDMFDYLIKSEDVQELLTDYKINNDRDMTFVKEMIAGPLTESTGTSSQDAWNYEGRDENKSFLYEIVSNKRNGVDVDKWDYFARDCHHLGIRNSFDHRRFMKLVKVLKPNGPGERLQICARDKECENLYEMFHVRSLLHRRAYQHRVAKAIDCMIGDAMMLADPYFTTSGLTISQCRTDPAAYTKLDDGIIDGILYSKAPELEPAQKILNRVLRRKLYKLIGVRKWSEHDDRHIWLHYVDHNGIKLLEKRGDWKEEDGGSLPDLENENEILSEIVNCDDTKQLQTDDLTSCVKKVDYGMKGKNPIEEFKFFNKSKPNEPYTIPALDVSVMLAKEFQECEALFFCKDEDKVTKARECFSVWCEKNKQKTPSPSPSPSSSEGKTSQCTTSSHAGELQRSRDDSDIPSKRPKQ